MWSTNDALALDLLLQICVRLLCIVVGGCVVNQRLHKNEVIAAIKLSIWMIKKKDVEKQHKKCVSLCLYVWQQPNL